MVENLTGGCQRLNEYGLFIGHLVGNRVKIALRKHQVIRERARMINDTEHRAVWAMAIKTNRAIVAIAACEIDFADDALPDQECRVSLDDLTNEFVSGSAGETVVAGL